MGTLAVYKITSDMTLPYYLLKIFGGSRNVAWTVTSPTNLSYFIYMYITVYWRLALCTLLLTSVLYSVVMTRVLYSLEETTCSINHVFIPVTPVLRCVLTVKWVTRLIRSRRYRQSLRESLTRPKSSRLTWPDPLTSVPHCVLLDGESSVTSGN